MMKIFTSNDFHGMYPVPTAAVIIANSKEEAAGMLTMELSSRGLKQNGPFTLEELNTDIKKVTILADGNY